VQQKTEQHSRDSSEAPEILIEDNLLAEQHHDCAAENRTTLNQEQQCSTKGRSVENN
jgi:hypothetical protein